MDIRVGKIVEIHKNPNSEKLYNEKIDIGNGEIRTIASGLQKLIPIEQMENQLCVVLCNLKALTLAGWNSHGMVLCAETPDSAVAELLVPPPGSQPGDQITFAGFERKPPAELNPKKNPWDNVAPKLKINSEGVAVFENIPFTTDKGVVKSKNITDGEIH
jgi:methionine--tRNA ligase beta chain